MVRDIREQRETEGLGVRIIMEGWFIYIHIYIITQCTIVSIWQTLNIRPLLDRIINHVVFQSQIRFRSHFTFL